MNNESTKSGQDTITQEMRDQLEWDRLQNEALAAQRWRLEQEMQQAQRDKESAQDDPESKPATEFLPWNKLIASTLVILAMLTVAVFIAVVGW